MRSYFFQELELRACVSECKTLARIRQTSCNNILYISAADDTACTALFRHDKRTTLAIFKHIFVKRMFDLSADSKNDFSPAEMWVVYFPCRQRRKESKQRVQSKRIWRPRTEPATWNTETKYVLVKLACCLHAVARCVCATAGLHNILVMQAHSICQIKHKADNIKNINVEIGAEQDWLSTCYAAYGTTAIQYDQPFW